MLHQKYQSYDGGWSEQFIKTFVLFIMQTGYICISITDHPMKIFANVAQQILEIYRKGALDCIVRPCILCHAERYTAYV